MPFSYQAMLVFKMKRLDRGGNIRNTFVQFFLLGMKCWKKGNEKRRVDVAGVSMSEIKAL